MNNDNSTPNQPPTEQSPWELRKPNWDEWKTTKQAKLWEAASLACDLDPSNFEINGHPVIRFLSRLPDPIEELLDMAKANIGSGGILKLASRSEHGLRESEVKLSNFAAWLKIVPHKPPADFPWLPGAITFSNMDWPWGRHETDLLRKLAAAADRFWKNYDPSDPTTAPTNQEVIDWLRVQDVAARTAEIIATILRADNLAMGPRK